MEVLDWTIGTQLPSMRLWGTLPVVVFPWPSVFKRTWPPQPLPSEYIIILYSNAQYNCPLIVYSAFYPSRLNIKPLWSLGLGVIIWRRRSCGQPSLETMWCVWEWVNLGLAQTWPTLAPQLAGRVTISSLMVRRCGSPMGKIYSQLISFKVIPKEGAVLWLHNYTLGLW